MKLYVTITGVIFGLLALAHLLRMVLEGRSVAMNPLFIAITVASAGLCFWAWRLVKKSRRP